MNTQSIEIIRKYYDAFNRGAMEDFMSLLSDDVIHDINQGKSEVGKEAFRIFMQRMNRHYKERAVEIVIFSDESGERGAAEFFIEGTYITTDEGLPPARNQKYRLRCGAFFSLKKNKITRVTNYYNLNEWLSQVK